jgi:hypothetical protein
MAPIAYWNPDRDYAVIASFLAGVLFRYSVEKDI